MDITLVADLVRDHFRSLGLDGSAYTVGSRSVVVFIGDVRINVRPDSEYDGAVAVMLADESEPEATCFTLVQAIVEIDRLLVAKQVAKQSASVPSERDLNEAWGV